MHLFLHHISALDVLKHFASSCPSLVWSEHSFQPGLPIALCTLKGTSDLPSIMLNGHMDVVPVDEGNWTLPPFAAQVHQGRVYARGSQDMKCVTVQHLAAMMRLSEAGLRRTVHCTVMPDEECGGHGGMELFVQSDTFKNLNVGLCLDEGLASPTGAFTVFNGEKSPWWIDITARGHVGHGSMFVQGTAMVKMAHVIHRFNLFREQEEKKVKELGLGAVTTVNLTKLSGGVAHNVIPAQVTASFDLRISPSVSLDSMRAKLDEWCSEEGVDYAFVQETKKHNVTHITGETKSPWWDTFQGSLNKHGYTFEAAIFPAATDARYVRSMGIDCFGFSPINNTPVLLHDNDEYLPVDVFERGIDVFEHLVGDLANM